VKIILSPAIEEDEQNEPEYPTFPNENEWKPKFSFSKIAKYEIIAGS
jgi:hypothetical protein